MKENKIYIDILDNCTKSALNKKPIISNVKLKQHLDVIIKHSESQKAVLTVTVTSLVKKIAEPTQDIRIHQAKMQNGYSGRSLDTKIITPFLQLNHFPAMSESGWLTRSLEQSEPYSLKYRGAIKPDNLKESFLQVLDMISTKKESSRSILTYLLYELIQKRDIESNLKIARPINLQIQRIISNLEEHFNSKYYADGASRLPVLAIYAVYEQMIKEVHRYKNCKLKKLESHTSPDQRSGAVGDIEIVSLNGDIFEGVEVKHNKTITPNLIRQAHAKFQSEPITRYYLLTTSNIDQNDKSITNEIINISKIHGCQVIVNGVLHTLKYYLRLLNSPNDFIYNYTSLLENDPVIKFEHKLKWNEIIKKY